MLEELVVERQYAHFTVNLLQHSPPVRMKSLTITDTSLSVLEELLALGARSLQHFILHPSLIPHPGQIFHLVRSLPALKSFTMTLQPGGDAHRQAIFNAFPEAPNMTVLTFLVELSDQNRVEDHLKNILQNHLHWDDLVKGLLLRFPRFEKLKFHLYAPRCKSTLDESRLHSQPDVCERMERMVREAIGDPGDYLSFQWFDED
ncbi:hypothetical protein DFH09DRAFT_1070704 [Mycena vulgaris]|nr:hypothetical protein DFH09DRAFT_1070704 [Mycena vulgaris]